MKIFLTAVLIFILFSEYSNAQISEMNSASDILLRLKKLKVLGSVLYIAAHPDDENTRLLAWLSKEKLYQTGYLSLTRGDGGQNLIGDEQGIELGLIRTQELMAARRVDGAEQFFSRAYDFGFSKTTAEALRIWNEQKILSDVVWIIRKFQPDVIITRFPEDKRAGHGQHSASSVLAHMAFKAAADPKQFPEQFAYGVKPWQAKRLFLNTYRFGNVNTTSEDQLKIEVGNYNALVGKSYGEIAADSRSQHRSQGFGVPHTRGNSQEYFSLTEGEKTDSSLLQNIDCSWSRIPDGNGLNAMIDELIKNYDPQMPYSSVQRLVELHNKISALPAGNWRDEKLSETTGLIQACSGLWLEATVPNAYVAQNEAVPVTLRIINRSPVSIHLESVGLNKQDSSWNQDLRSGENYSVIRRVSLTNLPVSQPYWLVEPMSPGSYNVKEQTLIGDPENPPVMEAAFSMRILGERFVIHTPVFYKYTDAVKGELSQPLTIVPIQMAVTDPELLVFKKTERKELTVSRQIKTKGIPADQFAAISLTSIPGFESGDISSSGTQKMYFLKSNEVVSSNNGTWVTQKIGNATDTLMQCRTISYDHIPRIDYFKPARSTVVSVNLKTAGSRIGYIEGAGDKVPDALKAMGYRVTILNESNITSGSLKNFDAVITGLRAYDVHDWLRGKYPLLMEYVKNGGNLIVQYNRNMGTDSTGIGPFPFGISNIRVTEEDAPVRFLLPAHKLFHFPNEITDQDFKGWIQERGIYFANRIDSKYERVLSMHDAEESDQDGSLITATYGLGNFTYTGLVFFRELPAGVPGAYRLIANIIALNQSKLQ